MDIVEELSCGGVPPSGPCSAWPLERHESLYQQALAEGQKPTTVNGQHHIDIPVRKEIFQRRSVPIERLPNGKAKKVNAGIGKMAKGLARSVGQAVVNGRVTEEIYKERYDTCKNCPLFIEESKRCSECGCFMEAKAWIGGDPDMLCPKQKWSR